MVFAGVRLTLVSVALLGLATAALAQITETRGTVQRVDAQTGTVYFTDGRTLRLEPSTRLYVDGREVRLADVQPGWTLMTSGPTVAPGTVVVQQPIAPSPVLPGVDATGIVGQVDARTGTITLQDGRIVRVTPGTTVWQPVTIGSVMPGASVFVRNAEPLDFRPAASAAARPYQMGTVSSVDASNARVILSDGTIVNLRPGTQATFNGQALALTDLRPGDEIVVGLPAGSTVATTPTGPGVSAMPRRVVGVIDGESIYVMRRPQAP
jgi:Cu/Ag efflux protein CusF